MATDVIQFKIDGMNRLKDNLKRFPKDMAIKAVQQACLASANVVKTQAKKNAPVKSGRLKKAIYVKRITKMINFAVQYIIGVRSGNKMQKRDLDAYYWKWLEFGTQAHEIKSKDKKALGSKESGVFGASVKHPGIQKKPFIVPAFESKKVDAFNKAQEVLMVRITNMLQTDSRYKAK